MRQECEFFLVKYVPDPVRNEFVHVGVILRVAGGGERAGNGAGNTARPVLRFTSDWRRVRCLDPDADVGMLEGLESELRRRFEAEATAEQDGVRSLMHVLEDSFSNSVQVTRAKGYLAESVEAGVDELMRLYVEPQKVERVSRLSGRAAIQVKMRTEFERAGVWDLLRKRIAAAEYTRAGDPLRIDVGYRTTFAGGVVRMFQAVSLDGTTGTGAEMAKVLAFSEAGLRAGVERAERAGLELTAVVEPIRQGIGTRDEGTRTREQGIGDRGQGSDDSGLDSERLEAYRFAVETMEEHRIRVVTTSDLGRVAETARLELGV
jgi:hypothetical protein